MFHRPTLDDLIQDPRNCENEVIQPLLPAASTGDLESIAKIVQIHMNDYGFMDAAEWADIIADTGNVFGYHLSMVNHHMAACVLVNLGGPTDVKERWEHVYERANTLLQAHKNGQINLGDRLDYTEKCLSDSLYGIATAIYYSTRESDESVNVQALQVLSNENSTKALFLKGNMCIENRNESIGFNYLQRAYQDSGYHHVVKDQIEDLNYSIGMLTLAEIYTKGFGIVKPDLGKAVEILKTAIDTVKDDDYRTKCTTELARYRQGLFGGYKYS